MVTLRIGGIASGLDTDQIVRDLMRVERVRVDRLFQQRQTVEWQKGQFRQATNLVRTFRDNYFNITRPETNMLSAATLQRMQASSSNTAAVTVTANAAAGTGVSTFEVIQSAARATASGSGVTAPLQSAAALTSFTVTDGKNTIAATLNGITKNVTVAAAQYASLESLRLEIQNGLDQAFGANRISAGAVDGRLRFTPQHASDMLSLSSGSVGADDILAVLQIESGASNRLSLSDTMAQVSAKLSGGPLLFDAGGGFTMQINGTAISVAQSDTLGALINRINNSGAAVTAAYSNFSDSFSITARETGSSQLTTDDGGRFISAMGISIAGGNMGTEGRDAVFAIDGVQGTRRGNTFTIEGITYSINPNISGSTPPPAAQISVSVDVEGIYRTIEKFIGGYNSLIEQINGRLNEERLRDFPPLTDEQKKGMSEQEIKLWEENAQQGLLRREPALENLLRNMRQALFGMVGSLHLTQIGIEGSRNHWEQGRLILQNNGDTLRAAIAADPARVADLFTRPSAIPYGDSGRRSERWAESGLAHRLGDILNDNIRITRDGSGQRGILLERAGMEGDATQFNNQLSRQITGLDRRIERANEQLLRREDQLFRRFTAMERALQQLHAQGDWLTMQLEHFGGRERS